MQGLEYWGGGGEGGGGGQGRPISQQAHDVDVGVVGWCDGAG